MSGTSLSSVPVSGSKLRPRAVNTCSTTTAKLFTVKSITTRGARSSSSSKPTSAVRPRTAVTGTATATATAATSSVPRRTRSNAKAIAPGRPPVPAAGEAPATIPTAPLTPTPTNTSHLGGSKAAYQSTTLVKTPSQMNMLSSEHYGSKPVSRIDSLCSSLPGSSDRGSTHRVRRQVGQPQQPQQQRRPPIPHFNHPPRAAPLTRAATAECIYGTVKRQSPGFAGETKEVSSNVCTRTQSAHELLTAAPLSPRCGVAAPPVVAPVAPPPASAPAPAAAVSTVSARPVASAPASRISSMNSRLADGKPSTPAPSTNAVPRPPRTGVVRTAGKRSSSANSVNATGSGSTAPAPVASSTAPPRAAGVRPLLPANRRLGTTCKENVNATYGGGVSRLRGLHPSSSPASQQRRTASQPEAGRVRSARTGGAALAASRQAPLSGRRVAGASPSRNAVRKHVDPAGGNNAAAAGAHPAPPPPSAPFQQTHTGCPPPLSFGGGMRGGAGPASSMSTIKGPVSPIKRTSTACPSGAPSYPAVAPSEDPMRDSTATMPDAAGAAFTSPWFKPGVFSTPTNRDSSEAPTIPYDGSTGQRHSLSLSPRTDFDTLSVSGRLSYGM